MNAINWLILKAQTIQVLEDGTVEFFFNGTLPNHMTTEIRAISTSTRVGGHYNHSDELTSWNASFGESMKDQNYIKFQYTDYTIPAGA